MIAVTAPKTHALPRLRRAAAIGAMAASLVVQATAHPAHHHKAAPPQTKAPQAAVNPPEDSILAVINGQVLTQRDVDNRGRLFALSTGQSISPELMGRLRPQIVHQLVDERLKTQEILKRHINIPPEQIAGAIANIEQRNGMPKNGLRDKLAADGVSLNTLIDQIRVQLGWMQVLREEIGASGHVTAEQIAQREAGLKAEEGHPQYLMSEIFVPVADPRHSDTELKFTQTIIQQLRDGAPFPIVAAEFSQSESALDGGQMGWVQEDALDPQVVSIVRQMPEGAISNPIRVAGGYVIATVAAKRTIGHQIGTMVSLRQAFFPFDAPLNPQAPTEQQKAALQHANQAAATIHSCEALADLNKQLGEKHPTDPGTVQLERLNPQMHSVLATLKPNQPSRPLVSGEGIAILMVCAKQEKNIAQQTPSEIADQLVNDRVEQESRQLTRDLQRRAVIDMRNTPS